MDKTSSQYIQSFEEAFAELVEHRSLLRRKILNRLRTLDILAPDTLQYAVSAMFELHYKAKVLQTLLGPSQTTISRWSIGQVIPRSAPYRQFMVEKLIEQLRQDEGREPKPTRPLDPEKTASAPENNLD